jgi:alpha-glucosidase (family GH31 glycosyl hydrolase)
LVDLDLDGGMVDFGDTVPEDALLFDGRTGLQAHNEIPIAYHRALWEEAQRSKPDSVFWMRSGAAGAQRFQTATWSGDPIDNWEPVTGIKSLVPAALSAGLSGFPFWHTEVSGYVQALPHEQEKALWLRWLQLGAFCPMLRDHYGEKPRAPVDAWTDAETLREYTRYATIHQRLVPYLYSLAREASETGLPLMRHLALEYPDDALAWHVEDAYLLGPDLLVAPVTDPDAAGRVLYLPRGEWIDWWTGAPRFGPGLTFASADRHTIPVFVRAGAALPLLPDSVRSLVAGQAGQWDETLVLDVQPASAETLFTRRLYDGTTITSRVNPSVVEVAVSGPPGRSRTYEVRVPTGGTAHVLEGEPLPAGPSLAAARAELAGYAGSVGRVLDRGARVVRVAGNAIRVRFDTNAPLSFETVARVAQLAPARARRARDTASRRTSRAGRRAGQPPRPTHP